MNKNILVKIISYPLLFIGFVMVILGLRWMIVDYPWMLDKIANEERLGYSFSSLFESVGSINLQGYLEQIYRFFGFWVLLIGLFLINFSMPSMIINIQIRNRILFLVGIMLIFGLYLGYIWIPNSHFIVLTWILFIVYLFSLFGMIKLTYENKERY